MIQQRSLQQRPTRVAQPVQDDQWVFTMLESLERHPVLWNIQEPGFTLQSASHQAWLDVQTEVKELSGIEKTVKEMKTRWETIKRESRKRTSIGISSDKAKRWKYANAMSFYNTRPRRTLMVTSSTKKPQSQPSAELLAQPSDELGQRLVDVLERLSNRSSSYSTSSPHSHYGQVVTRILDTVPRKDYREAISGLTAWIGQYQRRDVDANGENSEEDGEYS